MTMHVNWMQGLDASARDDRNLIYALVSNSAGVVERGHYAVAAAATGLRVTVDPGDLFITGDSINRQGTYHAWNDAQAVVQLNNAPAAQTRFDVIGVQIVDPEYDAVASPQVNLIAVAGTPGAGGPPSLAALPGTIYVLAVVEVRAGVTSLAADRVVDRRELVRQRDPIGFRVVADIGQGLGPSNTSRLVTMNRFRLDRFADMIEGPLYLNLDYPVGERSDLTFTAFLLYQGTEAGVPNRIDAAGDQGWAIPNVQSTAANPGRETVTIPAIFDNVPAGVWEPNLRVSWAGSAAGTYLRRLTAVLKPFRQGPVS